MPGDSVAFTIKKKKKLSSFQLGLREKQTNKQTSQQQGEKAKKSALVAKSQFGTTAKLLILDALPFAAVVQQLLKQVWGLP